MSDKKEIVQEPAIDMEEVKKVITALLQEFTKEEGGNKVTTNNMAGMLMKLMAACDGQISMKQPGQEN